uniref:GST N-terminal domain-containing protein n=1 Tax=Steinernema glaseri TaxID=37863 RepID=A0A1I7ZHA0_9BILA
MPTYKLYYFPARGRAEHIRQIFKLAGKEFEDVLVSKEQWPSLKDEKCQPTSCTTSQPVDVPSTSARSSSLLARTSRMYSSARNSGLPLRTVSSVLKHAPLSSTRPGSRRRQDRPESRHHPLLGTSIRPRRKE